MTVDRLPLLSSSQAEWIVQSINSTTLRDKRSMLALFKQGDMKGIRGLGW